MARNVAQFGRREVEAHRQTLVGVTASVPGYKQADPSGNKEWVVDVFLGPLERIETDTVIAVPVAPYARNLVTDIHQPVELARSKQGQLQVIGRAKLLVSGTLLPEQTILDATYHEVRHNLAGLGLLFIADLDFELEQLQASPTTELQADPNEPLQDVKLFDSFGLQIAGSGATANPPATDPVPVEDGNAVTCRFTMAKLGPKGDPLAMDWGVSVLQPPVKEKLTQPI